MDVSSPHEVDENRLRTALSSADISVLLPVLHQLTGDDRWLSDRYRPSAVRGMLVDATGGLSAPVMAEIREAAVTAVLAWSRGELTPASARPVGAELNRLMCLCTQEEVPGGYADMWASDLGFAPRDGYLLPDGVQSGDYKVIVIGAGLGGMLSALMLRETGVDHVVLERSDGPGGTWRDNIYPGAGVDVPSHLYSFSFFPRNWAVHFAKQPDVFSYIQEFVDHYELEESVTYGAEVSGAIWDEGTQRWTVRYRKDGEQCEVVANAVIGALGLFSHPKMPDIPGMAEFSGEIFHSARWPKGLDLSGKRVAVIGTGASAMQIVPAIAGKVDHLDVYQRSAQWVSPAPTYGQPVDEDVRWLIDNVPFYREWTRFRLAWVFSDRLHPSLQVDPDWSAPGSINAHNDKHRRFLLGYMTDKLKDRPDLLEKARPDYPPYGKRMLLDNGWFDALVRPDVELIDRGVTRFTATGIVDGDGVERPVDIVVMSTGFDVHRYMYPLDVRGRSGVSLDEVWQGDNPRAHLGITVPDFPNLFLLWGPNTNGSGGSYMLLAETQLEYIMRLIGQMIARGVSAIEPWQEDFERYNREVDRAHDAMIWSHPDLSTYYRNDSGRVTVNSPWMVLGYWEKLRNPDIDDFRIGARVATSQAG